jgi:heme o synthase
MIKSYAMMTKPGIIFGNALTTAAGFALASSHQIECGLFIITLLALSCVVASGCVINNFIDRTFDAKMPRTKNRALAQGSISNASALTFAAILAVIGASLLFFYTNVLTLIIGLTGLFIYTVLYSLLKLKTRYGTLIGSFAGAVPPLVGYVAVSNNLDLTAWILFTIVLLWQMPHFFAIAIFRLEEYKAALIPVLPLKKGVYRTKKEMLLYTIAFVAACPLLTAVGATGISYLVVMLLLGLGWLVLSYAGFSTRQERPWARKMFLFSLVVIVGFSLMIFIDRCP